MPIDFKVVLSARAEDLPGFFEEAESALLPRGVWRGTEVVVGGEAGDSERTFAVDSIARDRDLLGAWSSIYMEFSGPGFAGLGVQMDRPPSGPGRCVLSLGRRALLALHRDGIPEDLYAAFGVFARLADAGVGIGGFSLPLDETDPEALWARLQDAPRDRGLWADLLVAPTAALDPDTAAAWRDAFELAEAEGYSFFINQDLLEAARASR